MHFQLVSGDDLALILECSTVTRRVSERFDAFEAAHPLIGRLLVTVCGITGNATVASERPLSDHLVFYYPSASGRTSHETEVPTESYFIPLERVNIGRPQHSNARTSS